MKNFNTAKKVLCSIIAMLAFAPLVSSEVITKQYVVGATGIDNGPQDGVFDEFTEHNLGSVNNNGYSSMRTAVEYDIAEFSLPVDSATLTIDVGNFDGLRSVKLHSFVGNGQADLSDFNLVNFEAAVTVSPDGTQRILFDVAEAVNQSIVGKNAFIGFNLAEDPANDENFTIMRMSMGFLPTLSITSTENEPNNALVINDDHCQIADGSVFGTGLPNMVSSYDGHVVDTRSKMGVVNKVCKFDGVTNDTGSAVIYDYQSILDFYNYPMTCSTRLGGIETTDWKVTISTGGSATLRCKFRK